jgi:hypothetical protein
MSGIMQMNMSHKPAAAAGGPVTAGLVLNLDAGNILSYPGTGTVWSDTVGGKVFSLYNNGRVSPLQTLPPAYISSNGGHFLFTNGNRQWARCTSSLPSMTSYTAEGWWYLDYHNSGGIYTLITERGTAAFNFNYSVGVGVGNSSDNFTGGNYNASPGNGWNIGGTSAASGHVTAWKYISVTFNNSTKSMNFYINGSLIGSTVSQPSNTPSSGAQGMHLATRWDPTNVDTANSFLAGKLAIVRVYNAALTAGDITTNWNAEKARFGY